MGISILEPTPRSSTTKSAIAECSHAGPSFPRCKPPVPRLDLSTMVQYSCDGSRASSTSPRCKRPLCVPGWTSPVWCRCWTSQLGVLAVCVWGGGEYM